MFDDESPKLPNPLIVFINQLQYLKRSILSVLLSLPTSLLALLLLLLLAYNGFYVFCIYLPLSKPSPDPAIFSPGNLAGDSVSNWVPAHVSSSSSSSKISSSVMYVVKEENAPMFLKTHLPPLHNPRNSMVPIPKFSLQRPRRIRKHKRKLKSLPPEPKLSLFSTRMRDFFAGNSSSCKVRFFMTWISFKTFGNRELLAVESLFKFHPNACLAIVSNSLDSEKGSQILRPFSEMDFRVMAISPDFDYLFKNTPAEAWYSELRTGKVNPGGVSLGQNLSNLLRLALLYKFGGIYLDTDVIVLKSLSKLRNVIGAQAIDAQTGNWSRLNNAVLVFDKNHPLIFKFIQEFALTFDGNKWGHNGPYLVSRVVSRVRENPKNPGFNFTVLTPSAFYPFNWSRIRSLFRGPKDELHSKWLLAKLRHICSQSFALHLWNSQSRRLNVEKGSIIDHLMSEFSIFPNSSASSSVKIE
ncbi:hypothetical protein PRUPE_4G042800 [Prunus persica]|uniref:Alpha 1,4-glycosyltransferase domain-containing protein n=1 Tax=Prunus persica TaxID=3760 RepID=M5WNF6_PRUPE|nr:uncharacterized protein At4g19900 [Prunus persica]ONI10353.1 hypothetical protein PRUPE_4G042800 [Prunus persica]